MRCWSAFCACLSYALGGCSNISAEAGRVHPPECISFKWDLVWGILEIKEDKADWKHMRGQFPNELKHALLIETTPHRAWWDTMGEERGKHWVRLWRGDGSLVKPKGLSGTQPWASKPQHRCLWCGESPHTYISKPISWRRRQFSTCIKVRQYFGIGCLSQDSITFSVRKIQKKPHFGSWLWNGKGEAKGLHLLRRYHVLFLMFLYHSSYEGAERSSNYYLKTLIS